MSQIFRVIKPEMIQVCRFYGGHRNFHNHYETLRIPPDASQKDIRLAFLKLSKEMHPDLNKTTSHTDFVKITEAYHVLSKPHTKRQHDIELQYSKAADGRPMRVVYYDPRSPGWNPYYSANAPKPQDPNNYGDNYYGIKGIKRVSNVTIALLCVVLSAVGLAVQVLAINKSIVFRRDTMLAESGKMQAAYRKARMEADAKNQAERITAFEQRMRATDLDKGAKLPS